jgi:hypothetical protein
VAARDAAGACQGAAIEDGSDGEMYSVEEEGENGVEVLSPNLGDCDDAEYDSELERLERCYTLSEEGTRYTVTVRRARSNEADGTYLVRANGNLQYLGASIPMPEDLRRLSESAFERYCNGEGSK